MFLALPELIPLHISVYEHSLFLEYSPSLVECFKRKRYSPGYFRFLEAISESDSYSLRKVLKETSMGKAPYVLLSWLTPKNFDKLKSVCEHIAKYDLSLCQEMLNEYCDELYFLILLMRD